MQRRNTSNTNRLLLYLQIQEATDEENGFLARIFFHAIRVQVATILE